MRSSKFQIPSSKENPNSQFQAPAALPIIGGRTGLGTLNFELGTLLACAACYGKSDSALATGMNWGIFTLLGVILTVLTCIAIFFVHIVRKEEAAIKSQQSNHPADLANNRAKPACRSSAQSRRSAILPGFRESTHDKLVRQNL
jgi:predicted lipid-binding transport protein (Tim44 family)